MKTKYKGIDYRISDCSTADGRLSRRVYLLPPHGKGIMKRIRARSAVELDIATIEAFEQLYDENKVTIMDWITSGEIKAVPLEMYYYLRQEDLAKRNQWARRKDEFETVAVEIVLPNFGDILLIDRGAAKKINGCNDEKNDMLSQKLLKERMENIFHRERNKEGYSEEECRCWVLIDAIIKEAIEVDHLLEENPIESIATKCKEQWNQLVEEALSRRHFSKQELVDFFTLTLESDPSPDLQLTVSCREAANVGLLFGLGIGEICALCLGDFKRWNIVHYLEITKEYVQKKSDPPKMTHLLLDVHKYRRVVCSDIMEIYLAQIILRRMADGAGEDDPLFVEDDGRRLEPKTLKNAVLQISKKIIHEGFKHGKSKRGQRFGKGDDRDVFFGELLYSSAEYYYRTYCEMAEDMQNALLGVARKHTYGIYYTDWWSEETMLQEKARMEIWHRALLEFDPESGQLRVRQDLRRIYEGYIIYGTAQAGGKISIDAPFGTTGSIRLAK